MIPYSALVAMLPHAEDDQVRIPVSLFRFLLSAAVTTTDFDEEEYLRRNPDVAVAVRQGKLVSGQDHYINSGYFEGRAGVGDLVKESWYLRNNPDVARAVKDGEWQSAREHYALRGVFEWRAPSSGVTGDIARWQAAVCGPAATPPPGETADDPPPTEASQR